MHVISEVHIAPLGYEYDRIVGPVRAYGVDVVYLLEHDAADERPDYHDELRVELAEVCEVRTRTVDLFDIYDVLGEVTTLAAP